MGTSSLSFYQHLHESYSSPDILCISKVIFHNLLTNDFFKGYIPNCSAAVEAMLATTSVGAVWSSTSPDFGVSVGCHL